MMFGAAAQDISAGPLKVLINESAPYSKVTQDLDLMKLTFLAAYGISHDKKTLDDIWYSYSFYITRQKLIS